ncbi:MAG: hypothetical protein SGILL_007325, partial [Bacillariaceae sp.]
KTRKRIRIPCPLDPSHSIYQDMVEKHIQVCPHGKKRRRLQDEPFYVENVNTGGFGGRGDDKTANYPCSDDSTRSNISSKEVKLWAQRLARRVLQVHQSVFSEKPFEKDVSALTFDDIHDILPLTDVSQPELDAGIQNGFQSHHIKSGGTRHIPQLASLIGHLRLMKVLEEEPKNQDGDRDAIKATMTASSNRKDLQPLVLIDMGAGRGMFGLAAAGAATDSYIRTRVHLIMVERTGSRSKAEKAFRNIPKNADTSYLNLQNVKWSRCACDLAHVNLPVLLQGEEYKDAKVVVLAKHLCGAGTDLALKSLADIPVDACLFATCCHGICDWKHYVGREYLRAEMQRKCSTTDEAVDDMRHVQFGAAEFDLLRRWCAASVSSGHGNDTETRKGLPNIERFARGNEEAEHPACVPSEIDSIGGKERNYHLSIASTVRETGLSCGIKGLGRACKQLIDFGRHQYLQSRIFGAENENCTVKISHYVPSTVSPENTAIWGYTNWEDRDRSGTQSGK